MTMHLAHPSLTMGGKRKGKKKFRNADEARKARELDASWAELKKKHGVEEHERKRKRAMSQPTLTYKLSAPVGRETVRHPSLGASDHSGSTAPVTKVYTGDKILGIATMHKSNAVPVFSDEQAVDISRMRRG
jgi:hypothetical protein